MNVKQVSYFSLAALALGSTAMAQRAAMPPCHVQVERVSVGRDRVMRKSIGHAESVRTVQICAAVEGFLQEVNFTEGSIVQEGDVLMRIAPVRYEAALQQKQAAVSELEARIIYAERRYKRFKQLAEQFAASKQDMETALTLLETLRAKKAGAEADVAKAQKDLDDCTIRAEVTGRIGRLALSQGNYITKGEHLATLTQLDPMYVRFPLSQTDVDGIFRGPKNIGALADVKIRTVDGLRYPSGGRIDIVDNQLTGGTDSYTLWASFENPDHKLTHQSSAAVFVSLSDTAVTAMVPLTAVHHDSNGAFVYTLDENNTVERRNVTTGSTLGRMQSIYEGLKEGEVVITDGAHKTRPGATVVPMYPEQIQENDKKLKASAFDPIAVSTTTVGEMSDPTVIVCQGARVESIRRVELRPLVQGLLQKQAFREGDSVSKGAELFRIDPARYEAEVMVCKSALAQLSVSIADAQTKYERQQQLLKLNASSKDDLESAKALVDELQAQRKSAEAALVIAEDDLSRCVIRAGMDARIGRVQFSEGNYITDLRSPLATIVQMSPIYVRFPMSETSILSTFGNDERFINEADITLTTATGRHYEETGKIAFCDNIIHPATDTQDVFAVFENADTALTPGAVVTIRISRKPEFKVACVPQEAVLTDTAGRYVFVAQNGKAVRTDIICGASSEDGKTAVFDGLQPGQKVIINHLAELENGDSVTEN